MTLFGLLKMANWFKINMLSSDMTLDTRPSCFVLFFFLQVKKAERGLGMRLSNCHYFPSMGKSVISIGFSVCGQTYEIQGCWN